MELKVNGELGGSVRVPASKSMAHRLLICSALADAPSRIICPDSNDDVEATAACLRELGATIKYSEGEFRVWPIEKPCREAILDCGESGSTLRFMLPVAAALEADATFMASGRLPERPLGPLHDAMCAHGVQMPGLREWPLKCKGRLQGGQYDIDASISSQFISGLLMALPLAHEDSTLTLTGNIESAAYIEMTLSAMRHFGIDIERRQNTFYIKGQQYYSPMPRLQVEGDWSAAAFWLTAGCIGSNAISCTDIDYSKSLQGDRQIVDFLKQMGADIRMDGLKVTAYPSRLIATELDCSGTPDLVPALAVAAASAQGATILKGVSRLRLKESDRISSILRMLSAFGVKADATQDTLLISGSTISNAESVDCCHDHRIAMAAAILSTKCDNPVSLKGVECVSKSYPAFFTDLRSLGGRIG